MMEISLIMTAAQTLVLLNKDLSVREPTLNRQILAMKSVVTAKILENISAMTETKSVEMAVLQHAK